VIIADDVHGCSRNCSRTPRKEIADRREESSVRRIPGLGYYVSSK